MATYTYNFTANGQSGDILIETEDTPRSYVPSPDDDTSYTGYRIVNISGTFNGQQISGALDSNNDQATPSTDNNQLGTYDNVLWTSNSAGSRGSSFVGLDNSGIGFTSEDGYTYRLGLISGSNFFYNFADSNGITTSNRRTTFNAAESTPVCFCSGTLIRTLRGEVAVEDLVVGDLAVTHGGERRPIRWIGHREIACRGRADLTPVRIAAGALGKNRPARDLVVSPGHAVCLDLLGEVLIPAEALVNGSTIVQEEVESVTYWHVELDGHDILLAEGQPAESYLDMGNRGFFAEGGVVALDATPDARMPTHADYCRPFHDGGTVVEAVRAQLRARAEALGWRLDAAPWAGLHLVVDGRRIEADTRGLTARFVLPASAQQVWLVSDVSVPSQISDSQDMRPLGLCLRAITIDDGMGEPRTVALDDPRLRTGFHPCEEGAWRWTAGRSNLPAALFEGCRGTVFLRLDLASPALPRWAAPRSALASAA